MNKTCINQQCLQSERGTLTSKVKKYRKCSKTLAMIVVLLKDLKYALSITLPRCYLDGAQGDMEQYSLRGFFDASK